MKKPKETGFRSPQLQKMRNDRSKRTSERAKSAECNSTVQHLRNLQTALARADHWSHCVRSRYAGMISPSIARKARVSSLVADSRSCCHPLLTAKTIQKEPCDSKGYTLIEMHTDLTAVPHASLRNPNPERSRKVLKSLGVFKRKRGQQLKAGPSR